MGKQHTFEEHFKDVKDVYWETYWESHSHGNDKDSASIIWFTAYERWLNDRPLMSIENGTQPTNVKAVEC
jgi:hypothetical protein